MRPVTFETLITDQKERIERSDTPKGHNAILDWINDMNNEFKNISNKRTTQVSY